MTKEKIIKHLHKALNFVDITFPYRYVLVEAIEALSQPPLPFNIDEAVEEYAPDFSDDFVSKAAIEAVRDAFKAGAD